VGGGCYDGGRRVGMGDVTFKTHHVIKVIKDPSKDTLLSLNCSINVTLVIKRYLEINYLIITNNATIQRQQSSF
jgi:hypothetical protein